MRVLNSFLKGKLLTFYHTRQGQFVWKKTVAVLNRPFIQRAVLKALYQTDTYGKRQDYIEKLENSYGSALKCRHHALVVFPFMGCFATGINIVSQCKVLREMGYVVHAVCYSNRPDSSQDLCFDFYHQIQSKNPLFGRWDVHGNAPLYEQNEIDDWVSEDLLIKVDVLNRIYSFDLCICHYNWLSLILTILPNAYKVICTHDCFVRRNEKLYNLGIPKDQFGFSCSAKEEKKGLERADLVLSIQEEETNFFKKELGIKFVKTLPYVPEAGTGSTRKRAPQATFTIGYIGGVNPPNLVALRKFLDAFYIKDCEARVLIAGGISTALKRDSYKGVDILGTIGNSPSDLQRFYDKCDVVINPDTLVSGLKVKTIEAMAFHRPIVCTQAASIGLNSTNEFHLQKDEKDVAAAVSLLMRDRLELEKLKRYGDDLFKSFSCKYDVYKTLNQVLIDNMLKQYNPYYLAKNKDPAVSVIVPCYNVERYIRQALLSLLVQGFRDIEIIAIDDTSTDHTFEIIKELASMDKRIIVVRNEKNLGYGGNMNKAIKLAKGDFICILEPDDWVDSDMIGTLYESIKDSGCSVVKGGYFRHSASARIEEKNYYFNVSRSVAKEPIILPSHSEEIVLGETSHWSAIYRKSFLEEKRIEFPDALDSRYHDVVWKFFVYSESENILLIPQSFYHYRVATPGSSSKSNFLPLAHFRNYDTIKKFLKERDKWDKWGEIWAKHFVLDLRFHECRLANDKEKLNKFYSKAKTYLAKIQEEGFNYRNFTYPSSMDIFFVQEVLPTIGRINKLG